MSLVKQVKTYIEDNEFHIDIFDDRIHIANYDRIISLGEEKIMISSSKQRISFYGKNFSLSKMQDEEILIEGTLTKLEMTNE